MKDVKKISLDRIKKAEKKSKTILRELMLKEIENCKKLKK